MLLFSFQEAQLLQSISDQLATNSQSSTFDSDVTSASDNTARQTSCRSHDEDPDLNDAISCKEVKADVTRAQSLLSASCVDCTSTPRDLYEAAVVMVQHLERAQSQLHRTLLANDDDIVTSSDCKQTPASSTSSRLPLPSSSSASVTSQTSDRAASVVSRKPPNGVMRAISTKRLTSSSAKVKEKRTACEQTNGSGVRSLLLKSQR